MAKMHAKGRKSAFWLHTIEKNAHESPSNFTLSNKICTRLRTIAYLSQKKTRKRLHGSLDGRAPIEKNAQKTARVFGRSRAIVKNAQKTARAFERLRAIVKNAQKTARAFVILSEHGEPKDLDTEESERTRLTIQASSFPLPSRIMRAFRTSRTS